MKEVGRVILENYFTDDFVNPLLKSGYTVELSMVEKAELSDKNKILIIIKE